MTASPDTLTRYRPDELAIFHRNPRRGNVGVIAGSLAAHGQYKPIVVNLGTHTGRPLEVLAGNHTLMAIRNLAEADPGDDRWRTVLAYVVDVDDDRANRIVLADNRTAELGGFDPDELLELIDALPDLTGTGYVDDDLELLRDLTGPPPSLDDVHADVGDPTDEDGLDRVPLKLTPLVAEAWKDHRSGYSDDSAALLALLDR